MLDKFRFKFLLATFLVVSTFTISIPVNARAQTVAQSSSADDLQKGLAAIEAKIEARRKELGIPGLSLAIVKDDKIVFAKGFGYKDFEKQIAVTPDTEFAIGSSTKAFTALSVLMTQDAGKLSIDDSPKKYLPYFKINDPEIDSKITIRDLLSHSSGLNRTDLAWITGKLSREEIIKVAGEAKPTAKLREKFQYQNVMFTAAGEIVAQTNKMPWEQFVAERIFKPLGMTNSNLFVPEMKKSRDFSYGYEYNADTKETARIPFREFSAMSPAGAINSSANDMAQWVRFMLNGGSVDGKRLVSEASFAELLKPQMNVAGKINYGFGWFLRDWNGLKVAEHGGNIDGFNAQVTLMPEKKLGFVILTNVSASSLPPEMNAFIFENLIGNPNAVAQTAQGGAAVKPEAEIGRYNFKEANFDIEVKMQNGKLVAVAPGQPEMSLENVGGRRYKLTLDGKDLNGFFITFRDGDAYIEQPQGNYALPKIKADSAAVAGKSAGAPKELIGRYASEKNAARTVDVVEAAGKISLIVEGQPPYELVESEKDVFAMSPLPEAYKVRAKRDASGKITGIAVVQPEGEFGFNRVDAAANAGAQMTIDELMPKVIAALGGEAAWRKQTTRVVAFDLDLVHQGVKGAGAQYAKAPNLAATEMTFTAAGKTIGTAYDYFNGAAGGEETSFAPAEKYTGKGFEDARIGADFYGLLDWRTNYKRAELRGAAKVGEEDTFVVVFEPEKGNKDTIYFSQKTFLPVKLESVTSSSTSGANTPYAETYSDYRAVDGIMIPFRTVNSSVANGDVVTIVREVKHNVVINNAKFRLK